MQCRRLREQAVGNRKEKTFGAAGVMGSGDWLWEVEIGYGKRRLVMGSGDWLWEEEIGYGKGRLVMGIGD
jgi:hypothetical protein